MHIHLFLLVEHDYKPTLHEYLPFTLMKYLKIWFVCEKQKRLGMMKKWCVDYGLIRGKNARRIGCSDQWRTDLDQQMSLEYLKCCLLDWKWCPIQARCLEEITMRIQIRSIWQDLLLQWLWMELAPSCLKFRYLFTSIPSLEKGHHIPMFLIKSTHQVRIIKL